MLSQNWCKIEGHVFSKHWQRLQKSCFPPIISQLSFYLLSSVFWFSVCTQCKNSWNSCQDLAYSYIFPFTLETLDKILFILASHKPLEFLDSILGKSLIKSVKRMKSCKTNTSILFTSILLSFALPATSFFEVLNIGQHKVVNFRTW